MKNLVISNHPTTGQIAGIASCMEKITMYQFHSVGGHAEGTTGAGNLIEASEPSHFPSGHPVFAPSTDTTGTRSQSNARKNIPTTL